jgi:hypothetical protein
MVLGDWMQVTAFWYYQYVDGLRPDVRVFQTTDNWRAIGEEEHKFGRPLYLTRKVPEMLGQKHLGMSGPLIHWAGEPQTATAAGIQTLDAQFGDGLLLLGYRQRLIAASGWNAARPYVAQVSLWWQASHTLPKDYSVSLRLINAQGRQVAQADSSNPVMGLYPTSQWDSGEVVEDYFELRADPSDQSDAYHVEILIYWKEPGGAIHNLPLGEDAGDRVALAPLPALP